MNRRTFISATAGCLTVLKAGRLLSKPESSEEVIDMHGYFERITEDRFATGWVDKGIHYRSNIVNQVGAVIPLHVHSYDHHAKIVGVFDVRVVVPGGQVEDFRVSTGEIVFVPRGYQHSFTCVELLNGAAQVTCYWPEEK